jgi:hypothetical protein
MRRSISSGLRIGWASVVVRGSVNWMIKTPPRCTAARSVTFWGTSASGGAGGPI